MVETTFPETIVLLRHGESDENRIESEKIKSTSLIGIVKHYLNKTRTKHLDYDLLLSGEGEQQAQQAGQYIAHQFPNLKFGIVSPYLRAIQTAMCLNLPIDWKINNLVFERDWNFRYLNDRTKKFKEEFNSNVYFSQNSNGEKLYSANLRALAFLDYLKRTESQQILVVTHNEFMFVLKSVIEDVPVHQYLADYKTLKIPNCGILIYTRKNPESSTDVRRFYKWRKLIDPLDVKNSWDNGEWVEIPSRNVFGNEDLKKIISQSPQKFSYKNLRI
jgi:broad specificity phosphatase PhoE